MSGVRLVRDRCGASAAEFALVLPLLLIMLLGMIDAGRFLWTYNQAQKAVQVGVRTAVVTAPLAPGLVSTSYVGQTIGGVIMTQGDRVPAAALGLVSCTNTACSCTTTPCPTLGTFDPSGVFAAQILPRMQWIMPEIGATNVVVEYRGSGLGFAGDPNGADLSPLVTVRLTGMQFQPLTTQMFSAVIPLPNVSSTLTAEDLSGTTSF